MEKSLDLITISKDLASLIYNLLRSLSVLGYARNDDINLLTLLIITHHPVDSEFIR